MSLVGQRDAQVVLGFREVGFEGNGLTISGDGLIELAAVVQGISQVAVRFGIIGPGGNRLADQVDRHIISPHLPGEQPKQVQGVGMRRLLRQDLPVQLLGLLQAAGLVVLEPDVEGLLNGQLRHVNDPVGESRTACTR